MLIAESRAFQVATFHTLHLHRSELDQSQVFLDVMVIADEADAQLKETVQGLLVEIPSGPAPDPHVHAQETAQTIKLEPTHRGKN